MGKTTISKSKSHQKLTNLNYEEKQAAKPLAHLQAKGLSKSIVRTSEGQGTLVPR